MSTILMVWSKTVFSALVLDIQPIPKKGPVNPLLATFFRRNKNIYLHFVSLLHVDMTQVVEILPQVRQGPTYST